jgi:hypothetical protein
MVHSLSSTTSHDFPQAQVQLVTWQKDLRRSPKNMPENAQQQRCTMMKTGSSFCGLRSNEVSGGKRFQSFWGLEVSGGRRFRSKL